MPWPNASRGIAERILDGSTPDPNTGCWLWLLSVRRDGYARITVGGVTCQAHRVAYEAARGPIPSGLVVDHLCRQRSCVNVAHMELVTPTENTRRGSHRADREQFAPRLTRDGAQLAREMAALGVAKRQIGRALGISARHVGRILLGKSWRAA